MTPLYLYLLVGSLSIPLLYTLFVQDVIKHWKNFMVSTVIVAVVFLIWDAIFTEQRVWIFNHDYTVGFNILKMPIEEWLFFFVIPFCSLFIHFALYHIKPNIALGSRITALVSLTSIALVLIILFTNLSKAYTAVNAVFLLIVLIIGLVFHLKLLQRFFLSFLIILIPFVLVNGVLTGMATPSPIVSYDDLENLSIRFITIPIEDFGYAFTMLFGNLMIFETLNSN